MQLVSDRVVVREEDQKDILDVVEEQTLELERREVANNVVTDITNPPTHN